MTRPMTDHLTRVLDGLTGSERRAFTRAAGETAGSDSVMSRVARAVATEIHVRQLEEDELLDGLERDRLAELDELDARHPYPAPDPTMRLTFDPDTGEFVRDEDVVEPPGGKSS